MSKLLIELQYFGTISWYLAMMGHDAVMIESQENFEKSTYRNRCYIASPEGKLRLTIPLMHGRNQRAKYSEVKIDYSHDWQKNHWDSLCSCYRNSPYFEFYEDKFLPCFSAKPEFLFDFNKQIFLLMLELLELDIQFEHTIAYEKNPDGNVEDLRSLILPNQPHPKSIPFQLEYRQVFQEKTGFLADLCIADLLFNEGPHARENLFSALSS